ncbi:MAG: hypothetical protein LBJ15_16370 [Comamonas sp.]|jgi:Tfp pilus assembly protein PilO|uniref:hypothetical protein n=1 Tax=Comamonas sp. TaxID=34028 RepID=UPI002835E21A|nr:hypothetical protein [Comamonas sp.]MDR0215558.1 hypothetical protein [Comamonas sp.]
MAAEEILDNCIKSLERIQNFDVSTLKRTEDLGRQMSFEEAIPQAQEIVSFYKRIPISILSDLTNSQLEIIYRSADSDFNQFSRILEFSATASDSINSRAYIINTINSRRDDIFEKLWQFVAYGVAKSTDTALLEAQARATIQGIKDQTQALTAQLNQSKEDAENALSAIRAVASEQGVSQQAIHFKEEAQNQETLASTWLRYTYGFAGGLGFFAVLSLFLHKFEWIKPANNAEMLQLATSKVLMFTTLAYLLLMAARNYATHKHNAVVNRHRQNALLTYQSLVAAGGASGTQDIVLAHASACIFSPQETGFTQGKGDSTSGTKSVLELFTKGASKPSE